MKKFLIYALCSIVWLTAKADTEFNVVPFATTAGIVSNNYEQYFEVRLDNDVEVAVMQFDLYLPEGMTLIAKEPLELTEDRWNGFEKKGVFIPNATADCNNKGNGHYFITLYDEELDVIKGNTGVAFRFYYLTSVDMPDGYYPIRIEGVEMGPDSNPEHGRSIPVSTSYVKIGNPTAGTLTMAGVVPSFVNAALAAEESLTSLNLSDVTTMYGTFAYVPGRDVVAPVAEVTSDVTATIKLTGENKYASVRLPFDASMKCYTNTKIEDEYAVFDEVAELTAGTSAIVDAETTATATGVRLASVSAETKDNGYYLKADDFCKVNGSASIPALRGWWDIADDVRGFVIDGVETSISNLDGKQTNLDDQQSQRIYSVSGVRLNKVQRGVNIVDGKKVVIRTR